MGYLAAQSLLNSIREPDLPPTKSLVATELVLRESWVVRKQKINKEKSMIESHLLRRYPNNPILTATAFPIPVNSVFNAGAVKCKDQYILLTRGKISVDLRSYGRYGAGMD
jgi:hypothetical protein